MDRFVGGTQSIGKFNYVVCPTKLSVRYKQCIWNKPSDTRHVLRGETGKKEIQGYGLLPITTFCQGSTQMDDLVAKQETIKRNGIFSIQDFSTSRARKLSSHGDLAYCSARRYFGENIYNVSVLRELNLQPGWKWTGEKFDSFALSGETGKRRNSRVWISFNHNALPGYRKLGHRFNRFRDEGRQLLVFFF